MRHYRENCYFQVLGNTVRQNFSYAFSRSAIFWGLYINIDMGDNSLLKHFDRIPKFSLNL